MILDGFASIAVITAAAIMSYMKFRRDPNVDPVTEQEDIYSTEYLIDGIRRYVTETLQTDYTKMKLNREQIEREKKRKENLIKAKKECPYSNPSAKDEIIKLIKDLLQTRFGINEDNIDNCIPFTEMTRLTPRDKFLILVILYRKKYGRKALSKLIDKNNLDVPIGKGAERHFEITMEAMNTCFRRHSELVYRMEFSDKLDVLAQRCFEKYLGHGPVDIIQDMALDGFSGGISGVPSTFATYDEDPNFGAGPGELPNTDYNSIWILYRGHQVHLSFMGFETKEELIRVTSSIYKYGKNGMLTENVGYINSTLADGSRVAACRPPFSESWAFWVRKLDGAQHFELETMYQVEDLDKFISLSKWITRGALNIVITGNQGAGKTSLLMQLIRFLPASEPIRVQELIAELRLRTIYRGRNIASFVQTQNVSAQEGIVFQKKTDGAYNLFGEIASPAEASLAMQTGQVGSKKMMCTHHGQTPYDVIVALARDMITMKLGTDQKMMEETVASIVNFNIHLYKDILGNRHPLRVSEIYPHIAEPYPDKDDWKAVIREFAIRMTDRPTFDYFNVLEVIDGRCCYTHRLSEKSIKKIREELTVDEIEEFEQWLETMELEVARRETIAAQGKQGVA